ncbi:hybrid sensor histidine kinase/response regulator [Marinobacterium jannaschii]|uniref:hybrid sensor histidine kinase/response regulator n=1 Tax=Marinobacterium jannaschii TaxID=64970 RepID=UPI000488B0AD|nr:PAS domain-containing hybrid sensor histidine kinase/response regulator [Marinobacterium jannaschii]
MTDPALEARLAALEYENSKLRRINRVLIERIESSGSQGSSAYAAFEHSVTLSEQVRERTEALNAALSELKVSHHALQQANDQAATAHQRLTDAIESISDAFVLFDRERRIVLFNNRFGEFWEGSGVTIETGTAIQDVRRLSLEHGLICEEYGANNDGSKVFRLCDGRWMQMSERPTSDGGLVVLYTDISDLKAAETARREQALAQKTELLQSAVDNLSQGVVLINNQGELELWNGRFLELLGLENQHISDHTCIEYLIGAEPNLLRPLQQPEEFADIELRRDNGQVIEVRCHPLPGGGYVATYTDITERHRYAETLRQSEQWIRLITDHVPALIAYVGEDLCYRFTNKVYDEWYGWPRDALNGKHISLVHGQDQMPRLTPYIERALAGESVSFELDERNADGELRYMLKAYVPNMDKSGRAVGFFVMIRDITERRRTAIELQNAYEHMERRVKERTAELTDLNDQLRSEIDERRLMENRLREATKAAEQANLSKTKFLAAVSHDLLQPLNAARLFVGALSEHPLQGETRNLTRAVGNSLEDVESLLSTLVDISKLDAGVVVADKISFNVNDLLKNIATEYSRIAESENLRMGFVPSNAVIHSDSQLLARILRNFLSNAIRYTAEGGRVLLGCRHRKTGLVIEVWDTGVGIPQNKLVQIFQEFERLKRPGSGQDKGLGLGLAIVDKIAGVLGHQISVSSVEGAGSVFSVEVPYGQTLPNNLSHTPVLPDIIERLAGARIWVIDNDQAICEAMETLLTGWGADITTALSAEDLLQKVDAEAAEVDLLIADYHLDDGHNGIDAAARVRRAIDMPLPVLMITANYSKELKAEIRELGYMLMNKPVRPLKLKTTLMHMLETLV